MEERKRSRRLFGALIGTLSQGSTKTSVAQRRRADIEQKQQTKLKDAGGRAGPETAETVGDCNGCKKARTEEV